MCLPAIGQVAREFGSTVPRVSLSIASYFVGLALGQIFYGPFLDRFGRKPSLYFGLTLYIFALLSIGALDSLKKGPGKIPSPF